MPEFQVQIDRCSRFSTRQKERLSRLAQPVDGFAVQAAGNDHDRAGQLARVSACEMADELARIAHGRRAQDQSGDIFHFLQRLAHDRDGVALPYGDAGANAGFVAERAGRARHQRLGALQRFILHRGLDAAPLDKFRWRDQRQNAHRAAGLGCAPGGEAQGGLGLRRFVDNNQICPHNLSAPH